jgi:hypothetical protein
MDGDILMDPDAEARNCQPLPGLLYGTSWILKPLDEARSEEFAATRSCPHTVAGVNRLVLDIAADDEYCGAIICAECALEQITKALAKV